MTEAQQVLNLIRGSLTLYSEKEQRIAKYILENPQLIIHKTINQVAEDLDIAEATVFRFCKRLGFKGFQAMKIALASEVVETIEDVHEEINEDDSPIEVTSKVFQSNIRAMERTREIQNEEAIKTVVDKLSTYKNVYFYGSGGSGVVAQDAQHKFIRLGIHAHAYTDSHMQLMSAAQLDENSITFFISHSGSNIDILDALEVAKEKGAFTVAITNYAKSPLSKAVDVALYTLSNETEYRTEALSSRIAELSIIDALHVNYHMQNLNDAKHAVDEMRRVISKKRL
ncbi:MurR/RpiR family transcriptional regulator [Alkalibacillus sp. S2W]|uniref:MurR/RpiR family transcriptional regulator n=1 Tax=Alkalibacillus sp. S2W TaxID=3386553 RepID=UPI00398C9B24